MPNNELDCLQHIQACAARVTVLDADDAPAVGAGNILTVDGIVNITINPVYADGPLIQDVDACGNLCIDYEVDPSFRYADVSIEVCSHNPWLMAALTNGEVLTQGDAVGYAGPQTGLITGKVSLEVWEKRIDYDDLDVTFPYAWWVLPKLRNLRTGSKTFANEPSHPTFTAKAYGNDFWLNGPANDWTEVSNRAYQWMPTATLPTVSCVPTDLVAS